MRQELGGLSKTSTYVCWRNMIKRCYLLDSCDYSRYGGRGIRVCKRWRDSFMAFLGDMGHRPRNRTIGRIDNDGNYKPSNCRWETKKQQYANKRPPSGMPRGACHWAWGRSLSHKQKKKISDTHKRIGHTWPSRTGVPLPLETRNKISESLKKSAPRGTDHWTYGGHHSLESRQKMSASHKRNGDKPPSWTGKRHLAETRKRMSEARALWWSKREHGTKVTD